MTVKRFEDLGGAVAAGESYASDTLDFRGQLTKLINAGPDAIHMAAQSESSGGTIVEQLQELGYGGPIYAENVVSGTTALEIAGDAGDGLKAVIPNPDLDTERGKAFLEAFGTRYGYVTLPWFLGSAYDDVYIAAECLEEGEVVGLANVVVQVLPLAERTEDNQGYEVLGPAPSP